MRVLQPVMYGGWFFVQCHIDRPPRKGLLRDISADLDKLPECVKAAGHDRALVAVRRDNPRMHDFVQRRGFSFLQDYAHLKIYQLCVT